MTLLFRYVVVSVLEVGLVTQKISRDFGFPHACKTVEVKRSVPAESEALVLDRIPLQHNYSVKYVPIFVEGAEGHADNAVHQIEFLPSIIEGTVQRKGIEIVAADPPGVARSTVKNYQPEGRHVSNVSESVPAVLKSVIQCDGDEKAAVFQHFLREYIFH